MNAAPAGSIAWSFVRAIALMLASPVRLVLSIRRSMTAASVTLLLFGIISLNIVWGAPWLGPFSAIVTMLVIGWICNRVMRPKLEYEFLLPSHSPSGEPFEVMIGMRNPSGLPSMELSVGFDAKPAALSWSRSRDREGVRFDIDSARTPLLMLRPGGRHSSPVTLVGHGRGLQRMPDLLAVSMFPFHLFRSTQRFKPSTEIAITPRPLTGDEDSIARGLLDTLGGWTFRLQGGDALDYTGSREYEVGMPVRRWDFVSWARLGRPIVREFSAPSVQMVTVLVDTAPDGSASVASTNWTDARWWMMRHETTDADDSLERLLSLAATAVIDLCRRRIRTRLFVTSETTDTFATSQNVAAVTESEPLLIQLASASTVDVAAADARLIAVLEQLGRSPVLLLTRRSTHPMMLDAFANVTKICIAPESTHSRKSNRADVPRRGIDRPNMTDGSSQSLSNRSTSP